MSFNTKLINLLKTDSSFVDSGLELNTEDDGNCRFILCEQMDYVETATRGRAGKVIEQNGNGDFIYAN